MNKWIRGVLVFAAMAVAQVSLAASPIFAVVA